MENLHLLEQLYSARKLSRREFVKRLSALGLAAAASPSLMATPAFSQSQRSGGRFRLGLSGGSTSDVLDPAQITDVIPRMLIFGCLGNTLVEINEENNAIPELAKGWESTSDARQWIFALRKGVEFHNGKTLDADDVIYSLNHHRGEKSKSGGKSLLKSIVAIKKEDKYTVSFELASGNADFPFILSDYHFVIGPKDTDFLSGVHTGAYILKSFEPGVRAFASRNPNYFKSDRGWFDEVEILTINDVNARTNALKTGQVDAINRCELKTVHLMKRAPGIEVMQQNGFKHYTFAMLTNTAPYNDNNVRLALKHGIDRQQMVETILRGYGEVGNDHPISSANRFYAGDLPQRQYDPDKARFYLKKAGLKGTTIELHAADAAFVGAVDAGILYRQHAAEAGIDLKVVRQPNDGYWSNVWMKKPFCAVYWGGRPTEDMMFSTAYAANAPWNDTFWKNDRFNELLTAARSELDTEKRRKMYFEMQAIVKDDGGVIVPMFSADLSACSNKVGRGDLAVNWEMDGNKAAERWWFKA